MTPKQAKYIYDTIENEGFTYAFLHYSNFEEVKDEEFHRLRKNFKAAYQELYNYLGLND